MHIIIVKRADARGIPAQRFRAEVEPLPDRTCFKMNVAIASISENLRGLCQVGNHRDCETTVSSKRLLKAQICRHAFYISNMQLLQAAAWSVPTIHSRRAI